MDRFVVFARAGTFEAIPACIKCGNQLACSATVRPGSVSVLCAVEAPDLFADGSCGDWCAVPQEDLILDRARGSR